MPKNNESTSQATPKCSDRCECNNPQKRPCCTDGDDSSFSGPNKIRKTAVDSTIFEIIERELKKFATNAQRKRLRDSLEAAGLWPDPIVVDIKIFSDPIHGHIQIHPICIAIIDTPEFQRLRDLKQLGMSYFVYPGAAHNRFEHCLGVCHLAGQFVKQLKDNQPELGINNKDILCLEVAALCHDLGHGPFSHVFDGKVVPLLKGVPKEKKFKHEYASKEIFDFIYENTQNVRDAFDKCGLDPRDIEFIKELITEPAESPSKDWAYKGRGKDKSFLYEIVANSRNGIDVDKWDYIARDCHQLGIRNSFDHSRFMKFARVIVGEDGKRQICMRDKELVNLYNLFTSRYLLHKNAYQHKVICGLDIMVGQALVKAENDVKFDDCTMSEIIKTRHWGAYILMTDSILYKIRDTKGDSENLKAAQKIVQRIFNRDFYRCIHESKPFKPEDFTGWKKGSEKESNAEREARFKQDIMTSSEVQIKEDFWIQIVNLNFGMDDKNPLESMCVYSKKEPNKVKKLKSVEMSRILTLSTFAEHMLRVYVSNEASAARIKEVYLQWENNNLHSQQQDTAGPSSQPENASQVRGGRRVAATGLRSRRHSPRLPTTESDAE